MHQTINYGNLYNLKEQVKKTALAGQKKQLIDVAAKSNWFTCSQVKELLDQLAFPNDKIHCLGNLNPRIVDPNNKFQIFDTFTFQKDKDKASQVMGLN